jgi:regulatory protein
VLVTKIESQKNSPERVSLYINGEYYCGVSLNLLSKYSLYKGKDVTEIELKSLSLEDKKERFLKRCVDYLNRGMKSEKDISMYIDKTFYKKKDSWFHDEEDINIEEIKEYTILTLKQNGYLDDDRYAEAFVSDRVRFKPRSRYMISQELYAKGISSETANRVMNSMEIDDKDLLDAVYSKKYKSEPLYQNETKKINFLRSKGFNWDVISTIVQNDISK